MSRKSPSKKRKLSDASGNVTIQVEDGGKNGNPIVVSFPGGLPSPQNRPKFVWQKLSDKMSSGRKITGEDKHCVYSAEAKGLAFDDRSSKLCVGVFDKQRKVLILREAATRGTVFALQQSVPSYIEEHGVVSTGPSSNAMGANPGQVFQDFGSAKKQKVLRSQAANQVDIDHVVGAGNGSAVMSQIMKGEGMSESNRMAIAESIETGVTRGSYKAEEAAHDVARKAFLPKYDENAVKPHQVYSARDIAGEKAWNRVSRVVSACMQKDDVESALLESIAEKDWVPCALRLVKDISPDAKGAKDRYTCAILTNWLITFYKSNHRRKSIASPDESKGSHFGLPIEVATRFIDIFATPMTGDNGNVVHAMSKRNKEKCLVHVLILYIMAHGTAMKVGTLTQIAQDMKVQLNDCKSVLRLAGFTVASKGSVASAALTTPLEFPPPRKGGGGNRR